MNNPDHDPKVIQKDEYGNLTPLKWVSADTVAPPKCTKGAKIATKEMTDRLTPNPKPINPKEMK